MGDTSPARPPSREPGSRREGFWSRARGVGGLLLGTASGDRQEEKVLGTGGVWGRVTRPGVSTSLSLNLTAKTPVVWARQLC